MNEEDETRKRTAHISPQKRRHSVHSLSVSMRCEERKNKNESEDKTLRRCRGHRE